MAHKGDQIALLLWGEPELHHQTEELHGILEREGRAIVQIWRAILRGVTILQAALYSAYNISLIVPGKFPRQPHGRSATTGPSYISVIRVLGIDPGSRITGYGVIDLDGPRTFYVASGGIRTVGDALAPRLSRIFDGVTAAIEEYNPQEMAVELVFINRNADSALKLGQARGAALVAGAKRGLPVFEFTPAQIKQAIVGRGNAEKAQIQHMIKVLLNLEAPPEIDAADALAVALCHGHTREGLLRTPGVRRNRRGRFL